jgi:hypothetical protein
MRTIALVLAAFVVSGPAAAQSWKEYSYPDYAFSVALPANPQIETTTYQVADGRSVPARVYTVRQNNSVLKVTSRNSPIPASTKVPLSATRSRRCPPAAR